LPSGGHADLTISLQGNRWEYAADSLISHPPGISATRSTDLPPDDQQVATLSFVQSVPMSWHWAIGVEIPVTVSRSFRASQVANAEPSGGLGDPLIELLMPVIGHRYYQGLVLGLGARLDAGGEPTDWVNTHGGPTFVADVRGSTHLPYFIDCLAATSSLRVEYTRSAEHALPTAPDVTVTFSDLSLVAGAALSWQPLEWWCGNLRQELRRIKFNRIQVAGSSTSSTDVIQTAPVGVGLVFTIPGRAAWGHLTFDFSFDPWLATTRQGFFGASYHVQPW
jgi:hypothetical protein